MKIMKSVFILMAILFVFGCTLPTPVFTVANLRGAELTYILSSVDPETQQTVSNGRDYITLTFNFDGVSGTFDQRFYQFQHNTQAEFDEGAYSTRTWVNFAGQDGTFTWNPDTYDLVLTVDHEWIPNRDATTFGNDADVNGDVYPQDSYELLGVKIRYLGYNAEELDSVSKTITRKIAFTNDSAVLKPFVKSETADNTWNYSESEVVTLTEGGTDTVYTVETNASLVVAEGTIGVNVDISDNTITADSTIVDHFIRREQYSYDTDNDPTTGMDGMYLLGKETTNKKFSRVWKTGNQVTFFCVRTRQETLDYEGETPPAAPSAVDSITGIGSTVTAAGSYEIDSTSDTTDIMNIAHFGKFIAKTDDLATSYRGL